MTPLTWTCGRCGRTITEPEVPHTDRETGEDLHPGCCSYCISGQFEADQEQYIKEHRTSMNVGDPIPGHGELTREQAARTGRS